VESIAEALRPAPVVESTFTVTPAKLSEAMAALQSLQSLNERTRAVHAAGLFTADGCLIVREDVGRHNALDKVIGAAVLAQIDAAKSIVLLTSRVSIELVQKAARFGAPILAAISAPTAFAIDVAQASGITIAAILRSDGFEIFTKPERITDEAPCNAA
jgi:FdhD protein